MPKTNLKSSFFRARLFEKNRSVFVWDFGNFEIFNDFYKTVKAAEVKRDDCHIEFALCYASDPKEHLLDTFNVFDKHEAFDYDHPKRSIKTGTLIISTKMLGIVRERENENIG